MRQALCLAFLATFIGVGPAAVQAKQFPEPNIYPISWELTFKHKQPRRIVVGTTPYWYLTYSVINKTGQEQVFRPDFQMVTNDAKVIKSDREIPAEAFQRIKSVEGNRFLQPASEIGGPIHVGDDQAKDGVAIWKEPTARMGSFKIFVGGLSGEFVILKDDQDKPMIDPQTKTPVIVRKTLELDYAVYGDEFYPGRDEVHETGTKWVMR